MTAEFGVLTTCVQKHTRIVVSCDLENVKVVAITCVHIACVQQLACRDFSASAKLFVF